MIRRVLSILFLGTVLPSASCLAERDPDEGRELRQMAELLELAPGSVVADVGAGGGGWTFRLAEAVGETGHVYSTEVKPIQVDGICAGVSYHGLDNVTVILGGEDHMGLPECCCEALLLRLVYHAFDKPDRMLAGLRAAMQPGGRVLIIDFRPPVDELTRAMASVGFVRRQVIEKWRGQDEVYAVLFQKEVMDP